MDARFDQKKLFENLRDIDQAEVSGALALKTGSTAFYLYFQSGQVVLALESLPGEQPTVELNRQQALQLGKITRGSLCFDGAAQPPQQHGWHLRAAELILEAARRIDSEDQVCGGIGSFQQVLQPVFNIKSRARDLLLTQMEKAILAEVEVPITIQELIDNLGRPMFETLRSLYALLCAGILDPPYPNLANNLD